MKALINDIKRFAVHDGDGIRTTVFFKGCPLRCVWCHNPEGLSRNKEIAVFEHKCVKCGACASVCPNGVHIINNDTRALERNNCVFCGKCVDACPNEAIKIYGKEMTVEEIHKIVMEDKAFYDASGGGVTLSGGECLTYPDFCAELLKACKASGINTAVDTCGYVKRESLDKVIPYTDTFLYDVKAMKGETHKKYTGADNALILENLKYLDEKGCRIEIRIPDIPSCNHDEVEEIKEFVGRLKNVVKVKVLPYHDYARSKYLSLGITDTLPEIE